MVYLNSDGLYSEMCGNGLRCLARYAKDRGMVSEALTVATGAGVKKVIRSTMVPRGWTWERPASPPRSR